MFGSESDRVARGLPQPAACPHWTAPDVWACTAARQHGRLHLPSPAARAIHPEGSGSEVQSSPARPGAGGRQSRRCPVARLPFASRSKAHPLGSRRPDLGVRQRRLRRKRCFFGWAFRSCQHVNLSVPRRAPGLLNPSGPLLHGAS
ncbi:hypothetical protein BDY21DRAFT_127472 [Lineolata rhizophorae]|uniref:Uncharacterized protein n=1 Tax=Lineolata rhizophorae TaxID=578093 RepID=A0A6A6NPA9_9PEZI|nr:hypothetical protein BDY21DRAFT_127472 [Lineolata rhizophorae]